MSTVKGASPECLRGDPLAVSFSLYPVIRASQCLAIMLLSLADISLFITVTFATWSDLNPRTIRACTCS